MNSKSSKQGRVHELEQNIPITTVGLIYNWGYLTERYLHTYVAGRFHIFFTFCTNLTGALFSYFGENAHSEYESAIDISLLEIRCFLTVKNKDG